MKSRDCLIIVNGDECVDVEFNVTSYVVHDTHNCGICEEGQLHENDSSQYFTSGLKKLWYEEDRDFSLDLKDSQMEQEGRVVDTFAKFGFSIRNDSIVGPISSATSPEYRWDYKYPQDSDNSVFTSEIRPGSKSSGSFTGHSFLSMDNIDEERPYNYFTPYRCFIGGGSTGRGEGYGYCTSCIYEIDARSGTYSQAFSRMHDIAEKRTMSFQETTYYGTNGYFNYVLYLNHIKTNNVYVVALSSASGECAISSVTKTVRYMLGKAEEGSQDPSKAGDYLIMGFAPVEVEPSNLEVLAFNVNERNYVRACAVRQQRSSNGTVSPHARQFIFDTETSAITLSTYSTSDAPKIFGKCRFNEDTINDTFRVSLTDDEFINFAQSVGDNALTEARTGLGYRDFILKKAEANFTGVTYGNATFDFDCQLALSVKNEYDERTSLGDQAYDVSNVKNTFATFQGGKDNGATLADIKNALRNIEVDTGNESLTCIGFLGMLPYLDSDSRYPQYQCDLTAYYSYSAENNNKPLAYGTSAGYNNSNSKVVFFPCSKFGEALCRNTDYSKKIDAWLTLYPVFVYKKGTMLINVCENSSQLKNREKCMMAAAELALARSYLEKHADIENWSFAIPVMEDILDQAKDHSKSVDYRLGKINEFFAELKEASTASTSPDVDIYVCSDYDVFMSHLDKADLYKSVIVNMMAPGFRADDGGDKGRCCSVVKRGGSRCGMYNQYVNFYRKLKTCLTYICSSDFAAGTILSKSFAPRSALTGGSGGSIKPNSKYSFAFVGADVATSRSIYVGKQKNGKDRFVLDMLLEKATEEENITYQNVCWKITDLAVRLKKELIRSGMLSDLFSLATSMFGQPKLLMFNSKPFVNKNCVIDNRKEYILKGDIQKDLIKTQEALTEVIAKKGISPNFLLNDDAQPTALFMFIYACTSPTLISYYIKKKYVNGRQYALKQTLDDYPLHPDIDTLDGSEIADVAQQFVYKMIDLLERYPNVKNAVELLTSDMLELGDTTESQDFRDFIFIREYFYNYLFPEFLKYDMQTFESTRQYLFNYKNDKPDVNNLMPDHAIQFFKEKFDIDVYEIDHEINNDDEVDELDPSITRDAYSQEFLEFKNQIFPEYEGILKDIVEYSLSFMESVWKARNNVMQVLGAEKFDGLDDYDKWEFLFTNVFTDFPHAGVLAGANKCNDKYFMLGSELEENNS